MIKRTLENKLQELIKVFPVVILTGAHQVGKTTLLQAFRSSNNYQYISLDNPILREEAKRDPELFLQRYPSPLIIDEVQYAPELMIYIKMIVDEKRINQQFANGLYILSGSQAFQMMKNVSESLAGRAGILRLNTLSASEIDGREESPFLPTFERIKEKHQNQVISVDQIYQRIFRGSYPELHNNPQLSSYDFYSSYVQTYLERDLRGLINIKDELKFMRFLATVAARSGQELIYAELAKSNDIDIKTAQHWLSILVSSGLVYLLQPYSNSISKRIVKRAKIYFIDTGLACYLARFMDAATLEVSQMDGAILETYVISEIIKSYENNGRHLNGYYYRDADQNEIDLLIIENGCVYPLEIKKSTNPGVKAIRSFKALNRFDLTIKEGGVICLSNNIISLDRDNNVIPIFCI